MPVSTVPAPSSVPREFTAAALATDRYRVIRPLGTGGMATVYEVVDQSTDRHLALKRLNAVPDVQRQRRLLEMFEREFLTLAQIAHPRVVEAYDYGVDDQGAYYTMELLEGGELQGKAPLPAAEVCRIGRDICSALSLLHSRRLVYRDLNPRNVHCGRDGSAKLIDFGATAPMGPSPQLVGTPAYCAPEAVDIQPLDARSDLYSVGATLYYALTGRHARPARSFAQVREFLDAPPPSPSDLVRDVPEALNALIMELLHVDPTLRPAHAAEVMEQLAAIEGRSIDEQLQVKQAYLSTPTLVGREPVLARVRAKLLRALRGYGSAIEFAGPSGAGRTRLLAACRLEAKLLGALVLRADASSAGEAYGVARALGLALMEAAPELAQRTAESKRAFLAHVMPELAADASAAQAEAAVDGNQERGQVLRALREWFVAVARERPLLLVVDDAHLIDEPSAAMLALCAHEANTCALLLAITREVDTPSKCARALKLFETNASILHVTRLTAEDTEALLRSVFGDVPHVQLLAHKLHGVADGNPRDTLQLAQSLVDAGLARYGGGAWTLPAEIDDAALPADMSQALQAQVRTLSPRARALARVMCLADDRGLSFEECLALQPETAPKHVHETLEELIAAQMVRRTAHVYSLAHRGLHASLRRDLSSAEWERLHLVAAALFAQRGGEEFRRAMHLMRAGQTLEALDVLAEWAVKTQAVTETQPDEYVKFVQSMPNDWREFYTHALALAEQTKRPTPQMFALRNRFCVLANAMGSPSATVHPHLHALLELLRRNSGLSDYEQLASEPDVTLRRQQAMQRVRARHESEPEIERGLEPGFAMRQLARIPVVASGMAAIALDYDLWRAVPLLAPFLPPLGAVEVIDLLSRGIGARLAGRYEDARAAYLDIIARIAQPDRGGLDPANHRVVFGGVHGALGVMEAGMGLASSLERADAVESEPLYHVSALQIRMIDALWRGRGKEADQIKERIELLRIQTSPRQLGDGTHYVAQVTAHANSDDLTRMKHSLDEVRVFAERHPGWARVLEYASAEYQRMRGDYASALIQLQPVIDATSAGTHQIWPHAAGAFTRLLSSLGRGREAVDFGTRCLKAAEKAGIGYLAHYIRMPLASALADDGQLMAAAQLADEAIAGFVARNSEGLNLVLAYETRARVAVAAGDRPAYEEFAKRCAQHCRSSGSRALGAKYERLVRSATAAAVHVAGAVPEHVLATLTGTQFTSVLAGCHKPSERAERTLQLLLRSSGASHGVLYLMGDHGPELAVKIGALVAPDGLTVAVSEFIHAQLEDLSLNTQSEDAQAPVLGADTPTYRDEGGERHHLVLLCHQTSDGFAVTGAAALVAKPGVKFVHPGSLAAHLSRLTFDAGDVTPILGD